MRGLFLIGIRFEYRALLGLTMKVKVHPQTSFFPCNGLLRIETNRLPAALPGSCRATAAGASNDLLVDLLVSHENIGE